MFNKMCEKFFLSGDLVKEFAQFINGLNTEYWTEQEWEDEIHFFLDMKDEENFDILAWSDNHLLVHSQYEY